MSTEAGGTITVVGHGRASRAPDEAEIQLGIRLTRPAASAARADGAAEMERVLVAVEALGVPRTDVRTGHLALGPSYDYAGDTPRLTGYQLTNQVTITVRRVEDVAGIIDAAIGAGATTLDGVFFRVSDPAEAQREALTAAVADARERAAVLAGAAGLRITGVLSIREGGHGAEPPIPVHGRVAFAEADTPVLAGTTDITTGVSVVFLAEQAMPDEP
jgi:uncharacterized protein